MTPAALPSTARTQRLVGREPELAELERHLDRLRERSAQMLAVSGEPRDRQDPAAG